MLKVAILTANYYGGTVRIIEHLIKMLENKINIGGIIYDEQKRPDRKQQLQRVKIWYRRGGVFYVIWRIWLNFRFITLYNRNQASDKKTLDDISKLYKIPLFRVCNVNNKESESIIKSLSPDLAVSLGNRIIEKKIFSIPPLGTINLHHGKIPFYRGGPACFWEIYNDEETVGISIHKISSKIDQGELLTQGEVKIEERDDTKTLFKKVLSVDYKLVEEALNMFCEGNIRVISTDKSFSKLYTYPSYRQIKRLSKRKKKKIDPLGAMMINLKA